jgi:hypothetical protein
VRTIGHSGSANGQFAELLIVPENKFAVVSLSNTSPDGIPFNQAIVRWALENYLDLGRTDRDPETVPFDAARAQEIAGKYANEMMTFIKEQMQLESHHCVDQFPGPASGDLPRLCPG